MNRLLLFILVCLFPFRLSAQEDTAMAGFMNLPDTLPEEIFLDYNYSEEEGNQPVYLFQNSGSLFLEISSKLQVQTFSLRGLPSNARALYIDGILWNQQEDKQINFSEITPFYNAAKIRSFNGQNPAEPYPGSFNGVTLINTSPDTGHQQLSGSYSFSTGDMGHLIGLNYRSGNLFKNLILTLKAQRQWNNHGYLPGTFGKSQAFLASLQKQITTHHKLRFSIFGNDYLKAFGSAITRETAEIAGSYFYNPNWGWENKEKRNENQARSFLPAFILNYETDFSPKTKIQTSISFQKGYNEFGLIDWFKAFNPHPDYYQNLPSYYYLKGTSRDQNLGDLWVEKWRESPLQTDWEGFYEANRLHANAISGFSQASSYVVAADREEVNRLRISINWSQKISNKIKFSLGLQLSKSTNHYFRVLKDLLGGNYFVNLNQFAFQSYGQPLPWEQYDLIYPNRRVGEGEKYFYNFQSEAREGRVWGSFSYSGSLFKFYATGSIRGLSYQRIGNYQNGLFPENSLGASPKEKFITSEGQVGIQFQPGKQNSFWLNLLVQKAAPNFDRVFFDPRIRATTTSGIKPELHEGIEVGWQFKKQDLNMEIIGYTSEFRAKTEVFQFYHEDYETFVHYVLTGVNTRQTGIEWATTQNILPFLKIHLMGTWQQSFYSSRPEVSIFRDNDTIKILDKETVYWQNNYAVSGPQTIVGSGFTFFKRGMGMFSLSGVWYARNFVSLNPSRFTEKAVYLLYGTDPKRSAILAQERLADYFLLHLHAQKQLSFKKGKVHFIATVTIQNLLNKKGYALYGQEQLRFDFDHKEPLAFPNKYRFGYGRVFVLGIQYEF